MGNCPGRLIIGQVTTSKKAGLPSERRAHLVRLAGDLFAEKGFRATTVREIADAAGILSGSLYHHFDSKESIGDEILRTFLDDVLAGYRQAVSDAGDAAVGHRADRPVQHRHPQPAPRRAHHAAERLAYFSAQPRFAYLRKAMKEIERTWVQQLERGKADGQFRADLDARLVYRLLRDILWIPTSWRQSRGAAWTTEQIDDGLLRLIFDGITAE